MLQLLGELKILRDLSCILDQTKAHALVKGLESRLSDHIQRQSEFLGVVGCRSKKLAVDLSMEGSLGSLQAEVSPKVILTG